MLLTPCYCPTPTQVHRIYDLKGSERDRYAAGGWLAGWLGGWVHLCSVSRARAAWGVGPL